MAQLAAITLDKTRGRPTVEIVFGHAHLGNYRMFLWDAQGGNPTEFAQGDSLSHEPNGFEIAVDPAHLDQRILSVEMIVQAAAAKPGQIYSVTITVRQQNTVCAGGVVREAGTFQDVKALVDFRRFNAV